jgi:hypothetical protein
MKCCRDAIGLLERLMSLKGIVFGNIFLSTASFGPDVSLHNSTRLSVEPKHVHEHSLTLHIFTLKMQAACTSEISTIHPTYSYSSVGVATG